MQKKNHFFLISFLPAIAYWYLEENHSLKIALIGGLILAICEIAAEKVFTKKIHSISLFNFYLILALGGIALIGDEGIWFKLQPFFTGLFMGGFLLFKNLTGKSIILEMLESTQGKIPNKKMISLLERDLGIFMIIYGVFMAYVALNLSTGQWTFFKTIGFYIVSVVFFGAELFSMRFRLNKQQVFK